MKKYSTIISILALCLFGAYTANAQDESDTGRPIWVLGHATNSHNCLVHAIQDGANGVEIDVATDGSHAGTDWSVAHDGYYNPTQRASKNRGIGNQWDHYVSLEEYLKFAELDQLSLLWLDIKSAAFAPDLIIYVHRILRERYYDKKTKQLNVPFSIVYGFYNIKQLEQQRKIGNIEQSVIKWSKDSLWVNEGINLAYEGTYYSANWSGKRAQIQTLLTDNQFPIEKHFMTNGLATGGLVSQSSWRWQYIIDSREDMKNDKYCARIGFWSCTSAYHGVQCVVSQKDDPNKRMVRKPTECDVILMECRNDFAPAKYIPFWSQKSLQEFTENFFFKHGSWYNYNNGHYRRAKQSDKFYIRYSDPSRVRYQ